MPATRRTKAITDDLEDDEQQPLKAKRPRINLFIDDEAVEDNSHQFSDEGEDGFNNSKLTKCQLEPNLVSPQKRAGDDDASILLAGRHF